jgi:RNA polymerase sigma-70 factor (ECF subfamily)
MQTHPGQPADELLVLRCQDGEAEALAELVSRWHRPLWRHAYRLTGREEAAWEVAQEAWLSIVRGLRRLDDPARFRPWAYRIVTHKASDWIRKHQRMRQRRRGLDTQMPAAADVKDDQPLEDLHAALRRLGARQRVILSLRYLEELSVAEIAAILSIPAGTVKSRLHAAREELKRIWEARHSRAET